MVQLGRRPILKETPLRHRILSGHTLCRRRQICKGPAHHRLFVRCMPRRPQRRIPPTTENRRSQEMHNAMGQGQGAAADQERIERILADLFRDDDHQNQVHNVPPRTRYANPVLGLLHDSRFKIVIVASATDYIRRSRLTEIVRNNREAYNLVVVVTDDALKISQRPQECKLFSDLDYWYYSNTFGVELHEEFCKWADRIIVLASAHAIGSIALRVGDDLATKVSTFQPEKVFIVPDMAAQVFATLPVAEYFGALTSQGFHVRGFTVPPGEPFQTIMNWVLET